MGRVCVVGSFMMDLVIRAHRRPRPGETVVGTAFERFLGGKGFNQALASARSGATTSMIGRLGDDEYGRQFLGQLAVDGVEHRGVIVDPVNGTGIGAPLVEESGENSIVVVPRANAALTAADIEASAASIAAADVLLVQLELPLPAVVAACRAARAGSTLVVLNPAPAGAGHHQLRGLVDLLVPNEHEARALLGSGDPDPLRLAREWGCEVVVTAGGAGCVVSDGSELWRTPAFPVQAVDTVGAGDAFCGALAAWLAAGSSLRIALRYANAAGALAVTRRGAEPSMPRRAEIVTMADGAELIDAPGS